MAIDHYRVINAVSEYIVSKLDEDTVGGLGYKGILPPISSNSDYQNMPPGFFPFVGVSPPLVDYINDSMSVVMPHYTIQVIYSDRTSGTDPQEMMTDMLEFTRQIETILLDTIRTTRFDLSNIIEAVTLDRLSMFPTFYTKVDENRKAYTVAYFNVTLYLGGV